MQKNLLSYKTVRLFCVFTISQLFFQVFYPHTVQAQEISIDPTQEYAVHSLPENVFPQKQIESSHVVMGEKSSPSLLDTLNASSTQPKNTQYLFQTFTRFVAQLEKVVLFLGNKSVQIIRQNSLSWFSQLTLSTLIPGHFFSSSELFFAQHIFKSTYDVYIRGLFFALALSNASSGQGVMEIYNTGLSNFEKVTHWKVGSLSQDLAWISGTALAIGVFFGESALMAHPEILTGLATGLTTNIAFLARYITKETKSAFTETEKECKDREDNCSQVEDKGIILFFNYLPGSMPDLGIDDFFIRMKNNWIKKHQIQK